MTNHHMIIHLRLSCESYPMNQTQYSYILINPDI